VDLLQYELLYGLVCHGYSVSSVKRDGCKARSLAGQQGVELTAVVEGFQIVVAADVRVPDEDLRHGASAAALDHLGTALGLRDDVDLGERDALLGEQPLRRVAVAAERRRIDDNIDHARAHLTRGRFSARQPSSPPFKLKTFSKPALRSCAAARPEFSPLSQTAINTLSFCFFSVG